MVPTGTGRTKSVSSRPVTAMVRSSQLSEPSVSSSAETSTPPCASPGAPWWAGRTVNSAVMLDALTGPGGQVQAVRLGLAAAEAVVVVRAEQLPGAGASGCRTGGRACGGGVSAGRLALSDAVAPLTARTLPSWWSATPARVPGSIASGPPGRKWRTGRAGVMPSLSACRLTTNV